MAVWFFSDTHFGHDRSFIYEARGFASVEAHDAGLIDFINEDVKERDTLWLLGDCFLGEEGNLRSVKALRCRDIRIVRGNHDSDNRIRLLRLLPNVTWLGCAELIRLGRTRLFLSHYPTLTANADDAEKPSQRVWNVCGHSHMSCRWDPLTGSLHVEPEAGANRPTHEDELLRMIEERMTNE